MHSVNLFFFSDPDDRKKTDAKVCHKREKNKQTHTHTHTQLQTTTDGKDEETEKRK